MMSNELKLLSAAPLDFLKRYSVSADNSYGAAVDTKGIRGFNRTVFSGNQGLRPGSNDKYVDTLLTIASRGDKIAYTALLKAATNHYQLQFYHSTQLSVQQRADYLPMWILPWQADHITNVHIPAVSRLSKGPDLFFTSALSGCSVFVKGTPTSPTIYHAGTAGRDFVKYPKRNPDSAQHWRILFDELNPNANNVGEANSGDYLFKGNEDRANIQVYLNYLKSTTTGDVRVQNLVPSGTVFGIRDGNDRWTIYLQEKVLIQYTTFTVKKKVFSKDERIESTMKNFERPMCLKEIFPNGNGGTPIWNLDAMMA